VTGLVWCPWCPQIVISAVVAPTLACWCSAACRASARSRSNATTRIRKTASGTLIGKVIGVELGPLEYDARLAALLKAKVGLWDTVASAQRVGSLDASIREAEHTPLAELAATLPELRAVGFNGKTSAKIGMPQLAGSKLALIALPSSSPAHGRDAAGREGKNCGAACANFSPDSCHSHHRAPLKPA
jgi:hypoxanthine-DNA glycosylase